MNWGRIRRFHWQETHIVWQLLMKDCFYLVVTMLCNKSMTFGVSIPKINNGIRFHLTCLSHWEDILLMPLEIKFISSVVLLTLMVSKKQVMNCISSILIFNTQTFKQQILKNFHLRIVKTTSPMVSSFTHVSCLNKRNYSFLEDATDHKSLMTFSSLISDKLKKNN